MSSKFALIAGTVGLLGLAGCVEDTGGGSGGSKFGSGQNSKGESVTGSIAMRDSGSMLFLVNDQGTSCNATFDAPADRARTDLRCSDGSSGNAILRLEADGTPKLVGYFGTNSSGTVSF